jgi:GT2 family glycosyltransferase
MNLAPITLFVYNRPAHTRQTVEALQKNELAKDSDLIIYSDAPKKPEAAPEVLEVRKYIREIDGFKSIKIIERDKNWGLANSIIDGVTSVVNEYGRIIVLEDDLVTSPYFLSYMNEALETYQDDEKVMHISGYMFPIDSTGLLETFFLRTASCWGWATWSRAWRHFEKNPKRMLGEYTEQAIKRFNMDGAYNFWTQVEQNEKGIIDTWAVFWYATVFQKGGLCLHPKFSMVSNIGHDETGIHCGTTDTFSVQLARHLITFFERNLVEDELALNRTCSFLSPEKPTLLAWVFQALSKRLSRN